MGCPHIGSSVGPEEDQIPDLACGLGCPDPHEFEGFSLEMAHPTPEFATFQKEKITKIIRILKCNTSQNVCMTAILVKIDKFFFIGSQLFSPDALSF